MSFVDRITGREPQKSDDSGAKVISLPTVTTGEDTPYNTERGIVASAERLNFRSKKTLDQVFERPWGYWQSDAWEYFDAIGEIKYAYSLLAAVTSRLRIYAGVNLDPEAPPVSTTTIRRRARGLSENEKVAEQQDELSPPSDLTDEVMRYMDQLIVDLGSGHGGIPGLLRAFALNISIAGEVYLCKIDNRWSFRSTEEIIVRETDRKPVLRKTRSQGSRVTGSPRDTPLPANTYIGRVWKPHPRYSGEPDSSLLGLREICDELLTLQRMIRMIARSKMNAGMVFVPDGISAASSSVSDDLEESESEIDAFEQEFIQAMTVPVGDEASMSTVSPMVARGPMELGNGIKYIKFDRESDRALVQRADKALDRIMHGIDIPKDVVTGLSNVKYSNATKIDESLYKSHVEPLALLLVDSLATIYLRPALKAKFPDLSADALNSAVVWYDATEVVSKPDPAAAASSLYEQIEISGDALRRANGFSDTDAPSEQEMARRMAMKAVATMPPELTTALVKAMLPKTFGEQQAAAAQADGMPQTAQDLLYPNSNAANSAPDGSQSSPADAGSSTSAQSEGPTTFGTNGQENLA